MILLVGDYSSVHYELRNALRDKRYEVVLISDGDAYKKIPSDIVIESPKRSKYMIIRYIQIILYLSGVGGFLCFIKNLRKFSSYRNIDVVQFINPIAIPSFGAIGNIILFFLLKRKSKKISLCALGDDFHWVKACLSGKYKYSPLDRFVKGGWKGWVKSIYSIKYILSPLFIICDWIYVKLSDVIIPGLSDYEIAYNKMEKISRVIPLPIGKGKFLPPKKTKYTVKIVNCWQFGKEKRKGNDYLHEMIMKLDCQDLIDYEVIGGLTYKEFVKKLANSDVILDQAYSYDYGVTGAMGLAGGKLVVSGFEGKEGIGFNVDPTDGQCSKRLEEVLSSAAVIDGYKKRAYEYALTHHRAENVADAYLRVWGVRGG